MQSQSQQNGFVAQLNRAFDYESKGFWFESRQSHRKGQSEFHFALFNLSLYPHPSFMSEKEFNKLIELAEQKLREKVSKEEALDSLVRAGILDTDGNLTAPYADLATPTSH